MPRVTFVQPCVGREPGRPCVRSWQMQPLAIAVLAAHTPADWDRAFFDDRVEPVAVAAPTDLAAITIETYTARRGYEIADQFRRRGVPVAMGGYHATFRPDEALEHADAVCVGDGEPVWSRILADARAGRLRGRYAGPATGTFATRADRSIFAGKRYLPVALVEAGRGCPHRCAFCSITAFHHATHRRRPAAEVAAEVAAQRERVVFFVDDNLTADRAGARELFRALVPLRKRWIGQAGLDAAADGELLNLLAASGCRGLLIGFESLRPESLACMNKGVNRGIDYRAALREIRRRGIAVYGTFVFGLADEPPDEWRRAVRFAQRERMLLAAFNHAVPFPGTPFYERLESERRLPCDRWWMDDAFRFGDLPFLPEGATAGEIRERCHRARRLFFSLPSIAARSFDCRANARTLSAAWTHWTLNLLLRREVDLKRGLPLGDRAARSAAAAFAGEPQP